MPRPVIILNAVEHVQLAVARSLHRRGIGVTIADVTGTASYPPPSRAIDRFAKLPSSNDAPGQFVDALTELIRTGKYDMIIPCGDPGLVAGRESEGVPGMDICPTSQPGVKYIETRWTYYVNQLIV